MARAAAVEPELVTWRDFFCATGLNRDEKHQGICVFAKPRKIYDEGDLPDLASCRVVVALDQLSNPRNLAAVLRSSAFFGVDAVIMLRNRSAELSPQVVRLAAGGAEFLKIYKVINLTRSLKALKNLGYWVYGLEERGTMTIVQADVGKRVVLVVGAEGQGLRVKTRDQCDVLVRIPGGREGLESLNAAVATSIALSEVTRSQSLSAQ